MSEGDKKIARKPKKWVEVSARHNTRNKSRTSKSGRKENDDGYGKA
jgi:hypothetical protein